MRWEVSSDHSMCSEVDLRISFFQASYYAGALYTCGGSTFVSNYNGTLIVLDVKVVWYSGT